MSHFFYWFSHRRWCPMWGGLAHDCLPNFGTACKRTKIADFVAYAPPARLKKEHSLEASYFFRSFFYYMAVVSPRGPFSPTILYVRTHAQETFVLGTECVCDKKKKDDEKQKNQKTLMEPGSFFVSFFRDEKKKAKRTMYKRQETR
nr:hypothetical protein [Pandoravirus aubagnensis]